MVEREGRWVAVAVAAYVVLVGLELGAEAVLHHGSVVQRGGGRKVSVGGDRWRKAMCSVEDSGRENLVCLLDREGWAV
jgi:hypothetical protein